MDFDLAAWHEAHRPWRFFRQDGRAWEARHVSARQVAAYERQRAIATTDGEHLRALRWILRRAFPWRFSYLLRGDPVRELLALPVDARREALEGFFAFLWGAAPRSSQMSPRMNGTPSQTAPPALRT